MAEHDQTEYVALIEQDDVTDEVRDIAIKYDPLNRSGYEGFHVTEEGDLHIDDAVVMKEHKLIEKKIPNDAIEIVPLPSARGQLVHQYDNNAFRLYNLPAPEDGSVVGLLGPNGIGKSSVVQILAGQLNPNLGQIEIQDDMDERLSSFRGTVLQTHFERLRAGNITTAFKQQRIDEWASKTEQSVRELFSSQSPGIDSIVPRFDLEGLLDRGLADLSGGERQRVAIARTIATDADLYIFDEPSSFLDVQQRLDTARLIREHVMEQNAAAVVVEHDLATLDLISDSIHVLYGEPGGFGIVSQRLTPRDGINQFLNGRLKEQNVKLRRQSIEFPAPDGRLSNRGAVVFEYPALEKRIDEFELSVNAGQIHENDIVGIVGENALGKTTLAKLLSGVVEPDKGAVPETTTISYKPQYITPDSQGTVRDRFTTVTDTHTLLY